MNTLVYLELLKARAKFKNFPRPLTLWAYIRFCWGSVGMRQFYYLELPRRLLTYHRYDLYAAFMLMLIPNDIKNAIQRKIAATLPADTKYRLSRKIFANQLPPEER